MTLSRAVSILFIFSLAIGCNRKTTENSSTSPSESPIVSSGLVLNLDAAKASGTGPYSSGSGCAAAAGSALSWNDLTSNHLNGTLSNFGGTCSSTVAWNGDGNASGTGQAGPYRLSFAANNGGPYVNLGTNGFPGSTGFTVAAWVRTNVTGWAAITDKYNPMSNGSEGATLSLYVAPSNQFDFPTLNGGNWNDAFSGSTTIGSWYYLTATWDGTTKTIYVNANAATSTTPLPADSPTAVSGDLWLGGRDNSTAPFDGDIAAVQIYNRALTPAEISQNCNAYAARFSGVTCH